MRAIRHREFTVSEWDVSTQCRRCGKPFRILYYSRQEDDELPKVCPFCGERLEDPEA